MFGPSLQLYVKTKTAQLFTSSFIENTNTIQLQKLLKSQASKCRARKLTGEKLKVFSFNLGCFVMCTIEWPIQVRPSLEWKTWPRFCPVSLSKAGVN